MGCPPCSRSMHPFCVNPGENSCCCNSNVDTSEGDTNGNMAVEDDTEDWRRKSSRGNSRSFGKRDESLRDQQSTGRKRAAVAYPLNRDAPCEWQGLRFAGGGDFPIVGCISGLQQARHHGPDKNTLNNDEGNVWRICVFCHNRWHTLNDATYKWGSIYTPHDPDTKATDQELIDNEMFWAGKKTVVAKD